MSASEWRVTKLDEAMRKGSKGWGKSADGEHGRTKSDGKVFIGALGNEVPKDELVVSSAWAMKQKGQQRQKSQSKCLWV